RCRPAIFMEARIVHPACQHARRAVLLVGENGVIRLVDLAEPVDFLPRQSRQQRRTCAERLAAMPEFLAVVELVDIQPANEVVHFVRGNSQSQQAPDDRPQHGGSEPDGYRELSNARSGDMRVHGMMPSLGKPLVWYALPERRSSA